MLLDLNWELTHGIVNMEWGVKQTINFASLKRPKKPKFHADYFFILLKLFIYFLTRNPNFRSVLRLKILISSIVRFHHSLFLIREVLHQGNTLYAGFSQISHCTKVVRSGDRKKQFFGCNITYKKYSLKIFFI